MVFRIEIIYLKKKNINSNLTKQNYKRNYLYFSFVNLS